MANPTAEALKAKFDRHKGQITKAGNKIKELVKEDNVDDPNLQNAKLQTWKDRLLKKWELLEEILEEFAETETDRTRRDAFLANGAAYKDIFMAAMAQAAHYEKSIDLANKKAMVTSTTVVKDCTLFKF